MREQCERLTTVQHIDYGNKLKRIDVELKDILVSLSNGHPMTIGHSGKAYAGLKKAIDGLSIARCYLEEVMWQDHPELRTTKVYYGGGEYMQCAQEPTGEP